MEIEGTRDDIVVDYQVVLIGTTGEKFKKPIDVTNTNRVREAVESAVRQLISDAVDKHIERHKEDE